MTNKLRAAAQQALDALLCTNQNNPRTSSAIAALRTALKEDAEGSFANAEQPAEQSANPVGAVFQEPVAWMCSNTELMHKGYQRFSATKGGDWNIPVYTAPQPAKQPLTEDEAKAIAYVGPVYAPDGVVTRYPLEYRKELEQHRLDAIRRTEAAHGIK